MFTQKLNIPLFLKSASDKFGESPALISGTDVLSYNDYYGLIEKLSEKLVLSGIQERVKVAILSENNIDYALLIMALIGNKSIAVPLSTRLPKDQIDKYLKSIASHYLIHSEDYRRILSENNQTFELKSLSHLKNSEKKDYNVNSMGSPDQDATIIFTSGSSGKQKAVIHSLENHYYSALGSNENIPFSPGDRWLISLPMYHIGGLAILFRALIGGGAAVFPDKTEPLDETIKKTECTHLSLVATQLHRLISDKHALEKLREIKAILLGGSAMPKSLIQQSVEFGLPLFTSYGSTELASQITTTSMSDQLDRLFTSGKSLPYRELSIDKDGEILVRGQTLSRGYVDGENIIEHKSKNGWFQTGDMGFTKDGYLTVIGRRDTMFISGGENIHPEEVEEHILSCGGVINVVVVPVESDEFGQRPVAFIEMERGIAFDENAVREHLQSLLPKFKIPEAFHLWPQSKNTVGLKFDREKLQDIAKHIKIRNV